jgi:carbon storage regulator
MLILSRKVNEQIVIRYGEHTALVRIIEIGRGRVRLGVTAPNDVVVHREEIAQRILE